jgi:hypothetical protein
MTRRIRSFIVLLGVVAAVALVASSVAVARLPHPPPVKVPAPGHSDPTNLTMADILSDGGHCNATQCTDSHGRLWDCGDAQHCRPMN